MKLKKQYEQMARELARGNTEVLGLLKTIEDIRNQIEKLSGWRIIFTAYKKQ